MAWQLVPSLVFGSWEERRSGRGLREGTVVAGGLE